MDRVRIAMAAVLLACATSAQAATYYVDQTAGNDGNDGTNPSSAWKNAPGMAAYSGSGVLRPGDVVHFDRADTWLLNGTQGLYLVGGVTYTGDSWGTGTGRATLRASADLAAGVVRFRDHATYETVLKGFNVDANNRVTSGIDINHAFVVSTLIGATKRVQDTEVFNVASRQSQGQYKYGIIISNHHGTAGTVENVEIVNTVVRNVSRDAIALYPGDNSVSSTIRNITVRGSEAYATGQDPDYCCGSGIGIKGHVQDAFIEYNYIHDVKGASIFISGNESNHFGVGPTNVHIRHNIVTNATGQGAIRIYDPPSGGDPKDLRIYGNIVHSSPGGGLVISTDLKSTLALRVYNNTFVNASVAIGRHNASVSTFEFRNNIVYHTSGTPLVDERGSIAVGSDNIYFRSSGTLVSAGGTSYTASNLSSYEPSASAANPVFVGVGTPPTGFTGTFGVNFAPNRNGLALQPGSPGLDRGVSLAETYRTSINSVARGTVGAWDIGAYEAGSGTAAPAPPTNLRIVKL